MLLAAPLLAKGQNPPLPPPSEAAATLQEAVQQNPELADVIRQRLQQSGLTAAQVRARLQASGYPQNLLDAYLGTAAPGQGAPVPGALEFSAMQALGLAAEQSFLPLDTGFIRGRATGPSSRVFGVDVFRRTTTQFLPLLAGPVPPDYKLGPGDNLILILTGDVELAYTLQVTREGFILIPQVGQVFVSNLTLDHLRDVLYAKLGRVYSGVRRTANATTRFDISVANVRANQVYVVGEVAQPGAYQISSLGTALTALYAAGGVTERASMREIVVKRGAKTVATLDLYDYLLRGDTHNDIRLETGDVIFVPIHGTRVALVGAIVRPAIYELKPGQTLVDLIDAAGGFRPEAALQRLSVYRILAPADRGPGSPPRAVIDIALKALRTRSGERGAGPPGDPATRVVLPSFELADGDSVAVDAIGPLGGQYYVTVVGMVHKPGVYPWREGMTLRDVILLARGPMVGAYLNEAEIARLPDERSKGQLATTVRVRLDSTYLLDRDSTGRYVGPPGLPFPSPGSPEVVLQPYDNVLILKQPEFELQRTVGMFGEVLYPGEYALRTNGDRLSDLVHRAGGLTSRAYPDGIRFFRQVGDAGRINVDMPKALRDTASRDNVILQPGDSIFIPEYIPSVRVVGAVNATGSVLYKEKANLQYYIDGAGGYSHLADKGRVSVRFANGEVRTKKNAPKPGPGSEVFVPVRDTTQKTNYVALFGAIAQILASTVAIIVVVTRK